MIQGIVYVGDGEGIPLRHNIDQSIIHINLHMSSFFLTRQMGDAHSDCEGSMTPDCKISSRMSSSAWRAENGGRPGDCLVGKVSLESMSCWRTSQ